MDKTEQVLVLMIENERRIKPEEWDPLLHQLPRHLQEKIEKYHRWEDRQASLMGKLLLMKGLFFLKADPTLINSLQWDQYERPFITGGIDFNVTHTKGLVACALLAGGRIGLDAEAIIPIHIPDFKGVFTPKEYQLITGSHDPMTSFFNFWTRKEAIIKADGRGFYLSPETFSAITDGVSISGRYWLLKSIPAPPGYIGHLALPAEKDIVWRWLTMEELLR